MIGVSYGGSLDLYFRAVSIQAKKSILKYLITFQKKDSFVNKGFKKIVITVKLKVLFIEGSMEVLNIRFDNYDDDFKNSVDVEVNDFYSNSKLLCLL